MTADLTPVTGAWRPGDDAGHRQFFTFATDRGFALDCGRHAARRHRGLRDVGRARRRRVQRRAAVPRLDRRQPRRRPGRPGSSDTGLVGRLRRPGQADRHRPLVRRVRQRARRLPGIDRTGVAVSGRRQAVRFALPGDHDPRHGARPGPPRRPPRHRRVAHRDRWVDGRDAGPRVGRDVPRAGARRSCRSPRACRRRPSRSPGAASAGG